jgi:hypothetical protein
MACIGAGDLARARGDTARSAHHLQHALATCQELGLRHYEARTQALLRELGHVADPSPGQASGM